MRAWPVAVVWLVVLAACTGDGSGSASTEPTEGLVSSSTTSVPRGGAAATVAFAGGPTVEIGWDDVDAIVEPLVDDQDLIDFFFSGVLPPGFGAAVLSQLIADATVRAELDDRGAGISESDQGVARATIVRELAGRMVASLEPVEEAETLVDEVPYLQFLSRALAGRLALSRHLEETAGPDDGDPCVRQIVVASEVEAIDVRAELDAGAEFVVMAVEHSTGDSAVRGGDLGCPPVDGYVPEFANAVLGAEVGELVGPFETRFGWHLIVVGGYAVDGPRWSAALVDDRRDRAAIEVDPSLGRWDPTERIVAPADG